MSGFDEEAERERLREKYEQDQEKRATTQRMSELLLKGATMTNSHCDACGDPLFRYDGQTFCPTCQAADGETAAATAAAEGEEAETATDAEVGDGSTADAEPANAPDTTTRDGRPPTDASSGASADADGRARGPTAPEAVGGGGSRDQPLSAAPPKGASASLDDARASLSRTLVRYASAAEEADDPRRAKEFLTAAREAAETLAALDRR